MGKPTKNSATKVEKVPALTPTKTLKKGKREPEKITEKTKSAKKQKDYLTNVIAKKKAEVKTVKEKVKVPAKKGEAPSQVPPKVESNSDDSSSDDEPTVKKLPVAAVKKGPAAAAKKEDDSSNDSDSLDGSSSDEDIASKKKPVSTIKNGPVATAKKDEGSDESDSEDSSDDDVPAVKENSVAKKDDSSDESEDEISEESSDEEEPKQKKMKVQKTDVEMVDCGPTSKKEPTTPVTPNAQTTEGSKTVFVGNLPYKVEKTDMEHFFKEVGEVVDVRFAMRPDGFKKGFGYVEFASADAAKKAVEEMNGKELMGRGLKLDLAAERGEYTSQSGAEKKSFQKSEGGQGLSIFIRGLDTSGDLFEIKDGLREHFGSCGEITRLYVPTDPEGCIKGSAYMDFIDNDAFNKALELDQSECGQSVLSVVEAKPKIDNYAGGGRGGRSGGGRFGSGGRDNGGRFGSRGRGDRGGRGGRGRFGGGRRGGH